MKKIQKYKQTTFESCLACCLLQLVFHEKSIKITRNNEWNTITNAMKYTRDDFAAGHLDFISKKFKLKTKRYVHNKVLYDHAKKFSIPLNELLLHKIDLKFIDKLLEEKPIIISIDMYYLFKQFHYPHWIVIYKKTKDGYVIYEPWDGIKKIINRDVLRESLKSYFNRLWMAPQIVSCAIN